MKACVLLTVTAISMAAVHASPPSSASAPAAPKFTTLETLLLSAPVGGGMQVSRDALHAAYVYQSGVTSSLVVDGQEGRAWTKILRYAISDDGRHVAYVAQDEKSYVLVVDGQAGEKFEFIESQSLLFHGRTGRVLCAAENGQGHFLLVDGKVLGPYDSLGLVGFSDSGDSYAAVAALRPNIHCIVNGRESEAFQSISARVVFSPDGLSTPFR